MTTMESKKWHRMWSRVFLIYFITLLTIMVGRQISYTRLGQQKSAAAESALTPGHY